MLSRLNRFLSQRSDALIGVLIAGIAFCIFIFSPVRQMTDSRYSLLLSQSLMDRGSFVLDPYLDSFAYINDPTQWGRGGRFYQLNPVHGHLYYFFPHGSSVLSVPFVAAMNALSISTVNSDGTYNPRSEIVMQSYLATLLMAVLAAVIFFTSRLVLPRSWSILMAMATALGTQVWSTASRGLWNDTWAILLVSLAVYILLGWEVGKRQGSPVALASLLAWAYFVRPTNSVAIIAITVYLLLFHRRQFVKYAAGAAWGAGFVAFSWHEFGEVMPEYFRASRLTFGTFWVALAGNLISPSRGLLIYVPVLAFVGYLLVRFRKAVPARRLVWLSLSVIAAHLVVVSGFTPWNGGGCYGPRYTTGLVPWFALLGILSIRALTDSYRKPDHASRALERRLTFGTGLGLLALSVFVNARGAISMETWKWNGLAINASIDSVWNWRYPQFMAGLIPPPLPGDFPVPESRVYLGTRESNRYVWYGWSGPEPEFRWTDGHRAAFIFALPEASDLRLEINMGPFQVPQKLTVQHIAVELNGHPLGALVLDQPGRTVYSFAVPRDMVGKNNVLVFRLPDAASLFDLGVGEDARLLGVSVEWIGIQPVPPQR
jgi:hypothetical protein